MQLVPTQMPSTGFLSTYNEATKCLASIGKDVAKMVELVQETEKKKADHQIQTVLQKDLVESFFAFLKRGVSFDENIFPFVSCVYEKTNLLAILMDEWLFFFSRLITPEWLTSPQALSLKDKKSLPLRGQCFSARVSKDTAKTFLWNMRFPVTNKFGVSVERMLSSRGSTWTFPTKRLQNINNRTKYQSNHLVFVKLDDLVKMANEMDSKRTDPFPMKPEGEQKKRRQCGDFRKYLATIQNPEKECVAVPGFPGTRDFLSHDLLDWSLIWGERYCKLFGEPSALGSAEYYTWNWNTKKPSDWLLFKEMILKETGAPATVLASKENWEKFVKTHPFFNPKTSSGKRSKTSSGKKKSDKSKKRKIAETQ